MTNNRANDQVEIIERKNGFKGFYQLDILKLRHQLFSGEMGPELQRELFVRPDAVCVLPYDLEHNTVVLLEQFRVGALEKSRSPWLLEVVAGLIDAGEQPEQTAHREAMEEAGLVFERLQPVLSYYPSPGGSDEYVHLLNGLCVSSGVDGRVCGVVVEGENIRAHVVPLEQALAMVADGSIDNAAAIITLQWLAMNRQLLTA